MQLYFDGCDATSLEIGVFGDYKDVQWFVVSFKTQKGVVQLKGLLANMGDSMVKIPIAKNLWPEDLAN